MTYRITLRDNQVIWVDNVKYVTMYKDMYNFVQKKKIAPCAYLLKMLLSGWW